eukprot:TRINITY_DN46845_c0_g1_i1.p1 TRINITY_DN46845_c0_g1~~TRINITY_DN46845_c0_g1_i1.p1  ORF type:complete len:362 (+),score=65.75 TRINITY_DN46845_c0_g1_i1:100-1086(+)
MSVTTAPFELVRSDLHAVSARIQHLFRSPTNPVVAVAAAHLDLDRWRRVRACAVLLSGYASLPSEPRLRELHGVGSAEELLAVQKAATLEPHRLDEYVQDALPQKVRPKDNPYAGKQFGSHLVLAELTELLHGALQTHDSVTAAEKPAPVDSPGEAVDAEAKVALLAGDYLLSRASQSLATLPPAVVAVMCGGFEDASAGGVLCDDCGPQCGWAEYEKAGAAKTASLVAAGCSCAGALSDPDAAAAHDALRQYGYGLGMLIRLQYDLARPAGAPGHLFADEAGRKAAAEAGDRYAEHARGALATLPPSRAAEAMAALCDAVRSADDIN